MTRLIDAEELIEKLESNAWDIDEWELPHEQVTAGLEANAMDRETVENMPTIDAVPVVRCKDCKHYYVLNEVRGNCSEYNFVEKIPIDYCSWAERREE